MHAAVFVGGQADDAPGEGGHLDPGIGDVGSAVGDLVPHVGTDKLG